MKKQREGAPAWMTTFADLMALLTTFFIFLLSLSSIDAQRYKDMSNSLEQAFGPQWAKTLSDNPSGGQIIGQQSGNPVPIAAPAPYASVQAGLRNALGREIDDGLIQVGVKKGDLVISFRHSAAFESGSEVLMPYFRPIIDKIAVQLSHTPGQLKVEGHTDDVPISTARFRSNWDLSTARAASVVHQLLETGELDPHRLVAMGFADTRPLVPNDSPEHRARNRRVEIRVHKRSDKPEEKPGEGAARDAPQAPRAVSQRPARSPATIQPQPE